MLKAELYKIRTHRSPWVNSAILLLGVLTPAAVMVFYTPADLSSYAETYLGVYEIVSILVAVAFGGWLLGTEYRQGTTKRMLTTETRRLRALAAKAAAGTGWLASSLVVSALAGFGAARVVGSMNDVTVAWDGRALLASGLTALTAGALTFGLAAITRSDTVAIVGSLALIVILDPLLSLIPKIGNYTFGNAVDTVSTRIGGDADLISELTLGTGMALVVVALWLVVAVGGGAALFARRDV